MDGDINSRVRRLHAAIGVAFDPKVEGYKPKVLVTDKVKVWQQDFRGGASEEEIQNDAFTLIGHIASFRDHLRKWAPTKQINKENVDNILFASPDYCIVTDLNNREKHAGHDRSGGRSKKEPRVVEIDKALQLGAGPSRHPGCWEPLLAVMAREKS